MKNTLLKLIDNRTKGVDTYHNHGSMWLIFTDEKKWVIELTKEGTLWYNFYFFQDCFKYVSLDVVENQHYITEWVENIIQSGVKHTRHVEIYVENSVENIIQNGVKRTELGGKDRKIDEIKDIVENGIKETKSVHIHNGESIDSVIQNGIKETKRLKDENRPQIGNIIKRTNWRKVEHFPDYTDRITKKG